MQRKNKDIQCVWKYIEPSEKELKQIISDHETWDRGRNQAMEAAYSGQEYIDVGRPPHNLNRANLGGADLSGATLSLMDLRNTNLVEADLTGAILAAAKLTGANLFRANLSHAQMHGSDLSMAHLMNTELRGADLLSADFSKAMLLGANMDSVNLTMANLSGADLRLVNFERAVLRGAKFDNAYLENVKYKKLQNCRGINLGTCYGSPRFRRDVMDQDFLEEMQETKKGRILYKLWYWTSDCGRSMPRWFAWSLGLILLFALFFFFLGVGHFQGYEKKTLDFLTAFYLSVNTFTPLGFGQIPPITDAAKWLMIFEGSLGFVMLGGLISIFANKFARRAG